MSVFEKGICGREGYTYEIYYENSSWLIKVFYKEQLVGLKTIAVCFEPRCGMDVLDVKRTDTVISKIVKKHFLKNKKVLDK